MVLKFCKTFLVVIIFLYLPVQTNAWGVLGHRIVGQIADTYLTATTKAEIKKILGNESIAMASNRADFIKSDSTFNYLSEWHYINAAGGLSFSEFQNLLKNDTAVNAYTKINFLIKELKNKKVSNDKKQFYLRLLIHFVGDIHQPLHVGRLEDRGGNNIKVSWFNNPSNLHQVWDTRIIDFQQLSYTEYAEAINYPTKNQRSIWQKEPLNIWFWQSYQAAEKIYADIKQDDKLGYNYNFKYVDLLEHQLLKGGVHLAG